MHVAPPRHLSPRTALAVATAFALIAIGAAAAPQAFAAKTPTSLPQPAAPAFVRTYLARKLPGTRIARARYGREDIAAFLRHQRTAPVQTVADFNGDRKRDWAGFVRDRAGRVHLLVVYSTKRGYRHRRLQKNVGQTGYRLRVSVGLQKPGRLRNTPTAEKRKTVRLRRPGISLVYFEKSSVVFYWTGRRFAEVWTSD